MPSTRTMSGSATPAFTILPKAVPMMTDLGVPLVAVGLLIVFGLPRLTDAMLAHGYGRELVEKIAWRNWLSLAERSWGG